MNAEHKTELTRRSLATKMATIFESSVVLILICTSIIKALSALGTAPILNTPDPVFHFPNRLLLCSTALVELGVAAYIVLSGYPLRRMFSVLWLVMGFACTASA